MEKNKKNKMCTKKRRVRSKSSGKTSSVMKIAERMNMTIDNVDVLMIKHENE